MTNVKNLTLKKMAIYLGLCSILTNTAESSELKEIVYSKDIAYHWNITKNEAEGELRKDTESDKYIIDNKTPKGTVLFYNSKDFPLIPGNTYVVKAKFTALTEGAKLSMMLSMPGATRTPFPVTAAAGELNKTTVLRIQFKALDDEKNLRVHLVSKTKGLYRIDEIQVESIAASELKPDLTQDSILNWGISEAEGAKGIMSSNPDNGSYLVKKSTEQGIVFFYNKVDFNINPGKSYEVSAKVTVLTENTKTSIMLSMPTSSRKLYPVSEAAGEFQKPTQLKLKFTAQQDESKLRIHIVMKDKGEMQIDEITIKEKDIADTSLLVWEGENLLDAWTVNGFIKKDSQTPFISGLMGREPSISCDNLKWDAAAIRSIEVKFRASDEGGYMQLDFSADDNGRTLSSFQTMSTLADGQWHTLQFPVSEDPAWRGKIKAIKLIWKNLAAAEIAFGKISALPEKNLIPDAKAAITEAAVIKIPLIRPRGHYRLSWKGGTAPDIKLSVKDRNYKEIEKIELRNKAPYVDFTAPEMTMTAELSLKEKAEGYPLLELIDLPHLDLPVSWWRGSWIWCKSGMGPENTYVWFKKNFELSGKPKAGSIVIAGDDRFDFYLNGKKFSSKSSWESPLKTDIADILKPGNNELLVRVFNAGAWGAFIADLYAETDDGREIFISTDDTWSYHEGGESTPSVFEKKAIIIGRPPVPPWGSRVSYTYVGAMGEIKIIKSGINEFTAQVIKAPAVKTDKLAFRIEKADGSVKTLQSVINPSTDKWKTGETITVKYQLPPEQASKEKNTCKVFIASDFLSVKDGTPAGITKEIEIVQQKLPSVSISGTGTRAYINVGGEKIAPIYFDLPGSVVAKNPSRCAHHLRNAVAGGSRITRFHQALYDIWKSPSEMDFSKLDETMDVISMNAPDMFVIINLQCGMPDWWLAANPDEATTFYGGVLRLTSHDRQSLASKKWLTDIRPAIKKVIDHIKSRPYAGKVIGFVLAEGWNSEWFWSHSDINGKKAYAGFAPGAIRSYQDFLRNKYKTDAALAKAWNKAEMKFENAMPPVPERHDSSSVGYLMNPAKDRDIIDYFEFRNKVIADAIEFLCQAVKEETNGQSLAGAYYGYLIAFSNIHNRLQDVGHLGIEQIAKSPYVDYVIGPSFYTWRRMGMADSPMQPADTFSLHGKLVIIEQDLRNFSEPSHYEARNGKVNSVEESIGAIDRAFGMLLTRGLGTHWMEMYENWFREKVVLDLIKSQMDLYNSLPEKPLGTTPVEVCFVSDTESAFYTRNNEASGIHQLLIADLFRRVNETGFAYHHILLADILEKNIVKPHKLYVMTNTLVLDAAQRKALLERFNAEKATVVWLYGPGIFTPDNGPSAENLSSFLGVSFKQINDRTRLAIATAKNRVGAANPNTIETSPWFLPVSGFDNVVAESPDGKAIIVTWKKNNSVNYFSAVPNLPPEMLRDIALKAGVKIFSESGDPVHVGNDFIVLHAKTGGEKVINIPSGMILKSVIGPLECTLKPGEKFTAVAGRTYGFQLIKE